VGAWPGDLGDVSPPVGSRGRAPVGVLGDEVPQKLKQNVKLAYNFQRFSVENVGLNEYRSRAWTVGLYLQTRKFKKKILKIQRGEFERPL